MRSKFDEQLNLLNQEMLHMGTMIEESIQEAIEAFINQDIEKAHKIMDGDEEIDHEQKKIENICFNLLMQQQPVARDLRTISAAMKMVTDMERIGDHASDISEMTVMMSKTEYKVNIEDVKKMATETMLMLIRSIEAYVEKDNKKAECVMKHDDIVDNLFDAVKKKSLILSENRRIMVNRRQTFLWLQNILSGLEIMRQISLSGFSSHSMIKKKRSNGKVDYGTYLYRRR